MLEFYDGGEGDKGMKWRIFTIIVLICLVIFGFARLTLKEWTPLIARFLIINQAPEKSDIIIIPSGTDDGARIRYGVNLYKKGFAPQILLSGSSYLWEETKIDLMKVYAMQLGVPESAILVDHESGSTVGNAMTAKEIVIKNGYRSVLIVTSPTHSRRISMVFRKKFPKEVRVIVSSAPSKFLVNQWWEFPAMRREVFYEYFVFLYYSLFGY